MPWCRALHPPSSIAERAGGAVALAPSHRKQPRPAHPASGPRRRARPPGSLAARNPATGPGPHGFARPRAVPTGRRWSPRFPVQIGHRPRRARHRRQRERLAVDREKHLARDPDRRLVAGRRVAVVAIAGLAAGEIVEGALSVRANRGGIGPGGDQALDRPGGGLRVRGPPLAASAKPPLARWARRR